MRVMTGTSGEEETVAPPYLRPADIIARYRLSKSLVYEALARGELRGFHIGRTWTIPREAVDDWLRGGGDRAA